jgi:hypothetical protein
MFDSHPAMAVPDESHFIVTMGVKRDRYERAAGFDTARFLDELFGRYSSRSWWVPRNDVESAFADSPPADLPDAVRRVYRAFASSRGKPRYGDKTPAYVLSVGLLAELFPEGRFVHIVRDGRDVATSILQRPFGPDRLPEAAFRWKQAVRRGRAAGRRLGPGRYREVRYERLVAAAEEELRSLCSFAELPFDPAMLHYYENEALIAERLWERPISRPLQPAKRDWRREMSPGDVALFEALAGDLLTELGYERAVSRPGPSTRARARAAWLGVQARRPVRRALKLLDPVTGKRRRAASVEVRS